MGSTVLSIFIGLILFDPIIRPWVDKAGIFHFFLLSTDEETEMQRVWVSGQGSDLPFGRMLFSPPL